VARWHGAWEVVIGRLLLLMQHRYMHSCVRVRPYVHTKGAGMVVRPRPRSCSVCLCVGGSRLVCQVPGAIGDGPDDIPTLRAFIPKGVYVCVGACMSVRDRGVCAHWVDTV
jgi:hypothetical protein